MKRAHTVVAACLATLLMAGCASRGSVDAQPPAPATIAMPAHLADADFAPWLAGERGRIAEARNAAQQRFQDAEMACWRRFAVNDCVRKARVERRASMDELRQQELLLNELERERRTAARLRQLEQKQQKSAP